MCAYRARSRETSAQPGPEAPARGLRRCHDGLRTVRLGGEARRSAARRDRLPTAQAPSGCVHLAVASDPKAALALILVPISAEQILTRRDPILRSPAQGRNTRNAIHLWDRIHG